MIGSRDSHVFSSSETKAAIKMSLSWPRLWNGQHGRPSRPLAHKEIRTPTTIFWMSIKKKKRKRNNERMWCTWRRAGGGTLVSAIRAERKHSGLSALHSAVGPSCGLGECIDIVLRSFLCQLNTWESGSSSSNSESEIEVVQVIVIVLRVMQRVDEESGRKQSLSLEKYLKGGKIRPEREREGIRWGD